MLVEWIAFLQLEPAAADRDDERSKIHTLMLLRGLQGSVTQQDADLLDIDYAPADAPADTRTPEERAEERERQMLLQFYHLAAVTG